MIVLLKFKLHLVVYSNFLLAQVINDDLMIAHRVRIEWESECGSIRPVEYLQCLRSMACRANLPAKHLFLVTNPYHSQIAIPSALHRIWLHYLDNLYVAPNFELSLGEDVWVLSIVHWKRDRGLFRVSLAENKIVRAKVKELNPARICDRDLFHGKEIVVAEAILWLLD